MRENKVPTSTTWPPFSVVGTTLRMRVLANRLPPNTDQVAPPSVERARPKPMLPSLLSELILPVPAYRTLGFTGLMASEVMDRSGSCWSVSGTQVGLAAVALVVFQTPPLTVPA